MGGALIIAAIVLSTLLWADLTSSYIWIVLGVTVAFGLLGWVDDYRKLVLRDPEGLAARWKFLGQSLIGLVAAVVLFQLADQPAETALLIPYFKDLAIPLGVGFIVLTYLVIVGSSNAVNLTDGLDGLAVMPSVMVGGALGIFAYAAGNVIFAEYLGIPYVAGAGEIMVFCAALCGAGLGFLWFNAPPAQVFMGDTGSLALGGAIGAVAVLLKSEFLLLIVGGVFVAEAGSVLLQTGWFKLTRARSGTGRRLFRMAPLHHHFEKLGWPETRVVLRFYILSIVCALLAFSTLKIR